jgi:hypothetical protein
MSTFACLGDYLSARVGLDSSQRLYDLGLTRAHAWAVWHGYARLSDDEIRLMVQVYAGVSLADLEWFNARVSPGKE